MRLLAKWSKELKKVMTLLNIGFIIIGVALVIWGADRLTEGASSLARGMRVPEIVIGLTIVAAGTSAPELFVSLVSALKGTSDLAVGNVIGSNIFNTLLILGVNALIAPIAITRNNRQRDIPVTLLVTFLLAACGMSHTLFGWGASDGLSRVEGIVFLLLFAVYIYYCFKNDDGSSSEGDEPAKERKMAMAILLTIAGLAGLIMNRKSSKPYGRIDNSNLQVPDALQNVQHLGQPD